MLRPTFSALGLLFVLVACLAALRSEAAATKPNPIILLGIDGMEWSVIDKMGSSLPNFQALKARGISGRLKTDYGANSPVVWTTVATGVNNDVHGITNFDVTTDSGSAPVSSTLRKVPAIWNMVSIYSRRVMLLGWWGSWPAEKVNGIVVSDHAARNDPDRVSPPEFEAKYAAALAGIHRDRTIFPDDLDASVEDRIVTHYLTTGATEGFDLIVGYLHGIDLVSHKYWKYWQPEAFTSVNAARLEQYKNMIPNKYKAMDAALGKVVAAAPKTTNFLVISDHGFGPLPDEFAKISLELDEVFQKLGLQTRGGKGVDLAKSTVYNHDTAGFQMSKKVRFSLAGRDAGGTVTEATKAAVRADVEAKLKSVTWEGGEPVFLVRDAKPFEVKKGADFIVEVVPAGATKILKINGVDTTGPVKAVTEHSGGHGWEPPGIFIAAGPDINTKADLTGIRIHDITPTVLYGMGLPVAEDFAGKPFTGLFTSSFVAANPKKTIPTYGKMSEVKATTSEADKAMLEQLRELGYIE